MKRKRMAELSITVRYTTHNRIGAFLDHGTKHAPRTLATCPAIDHVKMLEFVRHWRAVAVVNYIEFQLSYEVSHVLRLESSTFQTSVNPAFPHSTPTDNASTSPSLSVGAGSESGHWQDSGASKPRPHAGSTPASRS